jgi:hypothetical protein
MKLHAPINEVDVLTYVFTVIIVLLVGLRVVLRQLKHERYYADDWVMFAALILLHFTIGAYRVVVTYHTTWTLSQLLISIRRSMGCQHRL